MLLDTYNEYVDRLFDKVKTTQRENIIKTGKIMAETIAAGKCIHIHDTGHIINSELVNRGGGLFALRSFKYELTWLDPVRERDRGEGRGIPNSMEGFAEYAVRASNVHAGDLIIIGSVSGRSEYVVDLAMTCKKYGCKVIAMTSLEYSSSVPSRHSSGLHLFECADVVLDNCAPVAEGMIPVEGIEAPFAAASGLTATLIMWSACAVAVEELLAKGITPSIYKSANFPGGEEYNDELEKHYQATGF